MGDADIYNDVNEICNVTACHLNKQKIYETFREKFSRKGNLFRLTCALMTIPAIFTLMAGLCKKKFLKIFLISFQHLIQIIICCQPYSFL